MKTKFRIGMVGYGYIGRSLYPAFEGSAVEVVSIHDRSESNITDLPKTIATSNADAFIESLAGLDLVVEVAHPDVSRKIGVRILNRTSYMPCSVVALADEDLGQQLQSAAKQAGTKLYIPHGAIVGMDNLLEARSLWKSVAITFRKPPASIDGAAETRAVMTSPAFEALLSAIADPLWGTSSSLPKRPHRLCGARLGPAHTSC